jgi:hypothetical protein
MNDSEFDHFLKTARADAPLPASFKQGVWHRIECEALGVPPLVIGFQNFAARLARPWGATFGIAATVLFGVWLGIATSPDPKDTKSAYAMSISPFFHSGDK